MSNIQFHTKQDFEKENDRREIIAMMLTNWAHCMAGNKPPADFGDGMVIGGEKAGILPTPENCSAEAKKIIGKT